MLSDFATIVMTHLRVWWVYYRLPLLLVVLIGLMNIWSHFGLLRFWLGLVCAKPVGKLTLRTVGNPPTSPGEAVPLPMFYPKMIKLLEKSGIIERQPEREELYFMHPYIRTYFFAINQVIEFFFPIISGALVVYSIVEIVKDFFSRFKTPYLKVWGSFDLLSLLLGIMYFLYIKWNLYYVIWHVHMQLIALNADSREAGEEVTFARLAQLVVKLIKTEIYVALFGSRQERQNGNARLVRVPRIATHED